MGRGSSNSQKYGYVSKTGPEVNERSSKRIEIRDEEGVKAFISFPKLTTSLKVRLFDLSSYGAGILIDNKDFIEHSLQLRLGSELSVTIALDSNRTFQQQSNIAQIYYDDQRSHYFLGLKFVENDDNLRLLKINSHEKESIVLDPNLPLAGFAYKELFFKEKAIIRVERIGRTHWILNAFDTELVLFKDLDLRLYLFLPTLNKFFIDVKVTKLIESKYESIRFEVEINELPKQLQKQLVNHLVATCEVSPKKLRKLGYEIASISDNFKFRYAKTPSEYEEVLKLRFEAYNRVGKVTAGSTYLNMRSQLDDISRILTVYHDETLVASITLTFPNSNELILDTEKNLPNGYPVHFPHKMKLIEIARFCVKDDYLKSHLVVRIFQHVYRIFAMSDREMLVSSADDKLLSMYKSIGMTATGISYDHPVFKGIRHHIVTGKINDPASKLGFSPIKWNYLYREMTDYLEKRGRFKPMGFQRFRIFIYRIIGNLFAPLWKD